MRFFVRGGGRSSSNSSSFLAPATWKSRQRCEDWRLAHTCKSVAPGGITVNVVQWLLALFVLMREEVPTAEAAAWHAVVSLRSSNVTSIITKSSKTLRIFDVTFYVTSWLRLWFRANGRPFRHVLRFLYGSFTSPLRVQLYTGYDNIYYTHWYTVFWTKNHPR